MTKCTLCKSESEPLHDLVYPPNVHVLCIQYIQEWWGVLPVCNDCQQQLTTELTAWNWTRLEDVFRYINSRSGRSIMGTPDHPCSAYRPELLAAQAKARVDAHDKAHRLHGGSIRHVIQDGSA